MKMIELVGFAKIYNKISNQSMSILTSYKLNKIMAFYQSDLEFYTNEMQRIIDTFSKKDENGSPILNGENVVMEESSMTQAKEAADNLDKLELQFCNVSFELKELETLELTPADLYYLMPFIKE